MGHASRHFSDGYSRTAASLSFLPIPSVPPLRFSSHVHKLPLCSKRLGTTVKSIIWRANIVHGHSNMISSLIESLDLAISPDFRHLQTARAATSTEIGRNSGSGDHGNISSTYASSSGQRGHPPTAKSWHSLPNEPELQHGSTGDRPHVSVDPDTANEGAHDQDAGAATAEHVRYFAEVEDTSNARLGNDQHGDTGDTPPQPSRCIPEASRHEGNADAGDPDVPRQESVAEVLSRLVPKDSALQLSIDRRRSKMWLVDDDEALFVTPFGLVSHESPAVLLRVRQRIAAGSLVIIEDLNMKTCKALESEYPLLDRQFLAEHMLRSDEPVSKKAAGKLQEYVQQHVNHPCPARFGVECNYTFNEGTTLHFDLPPSTHDDSCFHLDLYWEDLTPETTHCLNAMELLWTREPRSPPAFRYDRFVKSTAGQWKKVSARLSCCQLTSNSSRSAMIIS